MVNVPVAKTPHKGLTAVFGPISLVVEFTRVPDDFVDELAHAHGVGGWRGSAGLDAAVFRVGHVGHVVGGVEVYTVPAAVVVLDGGCGTAVMRGSGKDGRMGGGSYVGKRTAVMIPVLQGLSGKSSVCGSRVLMLSRQVNVSCLKRSASSLVRALTSPMNMRKPCCC